MFVVQVGYVVWRFPALEQAQRGEDCRAFGAVVDPPVQCRHDGDVGHVDADCCNRSSGHVSGQVRRTKRMIVRVD